MPDVLCFICTFSQMLVQVSWLRLSVLQSGRCRTGQRIHTWQYVVTPGLPVSIGAEKHKAECMVTVSGFILYNIETARNLNDPA